MKIMKIVITDGFTVNPGDLDWKGIQALGDIIYYERSNSNDVAARCEPAEIIVANKTPITAEVIERAPALKLITITATGYNNIDLEMAKSKGVIVCNVPEYGTWSVSQHAFALVLELANHVGLNAASVAQGEWSGGQEWSYTKKPLMELKDKVLGIVGLGRIGQQTALLGKAFGMKVQYVNRSRVKTDLGKAVTTDELFTTSDVISLHCPLTPENTRFVDRRLLSLMKPSAFLVNTSRGGLINEPDLVSVLQQKSIAGVALDVLTVEPPDASALIGLSNCIITPHTAWVSIEARRRILETTAGNIKSFLSGNPQNVVNA